MDDALFVLLLPMGWYVVFSLLTFALVVPVTNSNDYISIIITIIGIIFIFYIFNFDTAFGVIPSYVVFGCVFFICRRCVICCIRDTVLFLRRVVTRVLISWIFLLSIGCIISANIEYFRRLIFWHFHLLHVYVVVVGSHWGRGGTIHSISMRSDTHNTGIVTGPSGHGVVILYLLICGCSICLVCIKLHPWELGRD